MVGFSISQAIKSISNEKCSKCGSQAKGLIYQKQTVTYYCKKCLKKYTKQDEMPMKNGELAINS
ncbi:TPA: hypothetical protein ENX78_15365 [Candidatus Poribacteria bacterium]|nr:hypothetical protein [Candidatus Poribacteria bacterium]